VVLQEEMLMNSFFYLATAHSWHALMWNNLRTIYEETGMLSMMAIQDKLSSLLKMMEIVNMPHMLNDATLNRFPRSFVSHE
jgi:hypothetical protein